MEDKTMNGESADNRVHSADEKPTGDGDHESSAYKVVVRDVDYEGKPTEEELATLRRVPGKVPTVAYMLCAVEFCERASYYGCVLIWTNYINRPLPKGGNGYGAVPNGSQATQGALGLGERIANATSQSFSLLAYCLPLVIGYLADTKFGRFNMIFWGVIVCGVGHVLIVAGGAKQLIENGTAKIPFFIGVYILALGAAMFKPNVAPLLLDQMNTHVPRVITLPSGERVIEDPEHSAERVMLWFYLLINIGAFMSVGTSYSARRVGWWLAFLLTLILYLPLPLLLIWLKPRLAHHKPGGSDLPNVFRVFGHCMRHGGIYRIGRRGWWDAARPSVIAAKGLKPETHYNDAFVDDVKRTMQAAGMFICIPVQFWNDNGIGSSANFLGTMLTGNGVPNDVIQNFNALTVICLGPILNYGLYPFLRNSRIRYGPVARMTTGFFLSTLAGIGYCVLCYFAYQTSPCGWYGSSDPVCVEEGLVSPISLWWEAIPYALGGSSELFINVPAYGIAYSRAPVNMRGFVSALNLLNTGIAYSVNLAVSAVVADPHLVWDFGAPAILGAFMTVFFYFTFRRIDKEEYVLSKNQAIATESVERNGEGHGEDIVPTKA
ncbi:peptide transporter ptr2 [Purpureocillium takamizusanense]|uniref:Peptide transporter ptr2 n=1 Tax=Purpureocillium takamizusanense TaxID=2060973 RepID=A0A9Q8QRR1_9HYPO|nr:peptide transporter ptr2 [Purpureocillium takamizusanense]UNI24458.1 peptide transporter ptr2 [Purpureocillium takamizusanense]